MRPAAVIVLVSLALAPAPAFADELGMARSETLEAAGDAYRLGDYAAALALLRPLAEDGVAEAQFTLGFMHAEGRGVPRDYRAAAALYEQAARQGHAQAQNYPGLLYFEGRGVARSFRQTFVFFELAAAAGDRDAANNRLIVARRMTSAEITEAQKDAGQMIAELASTAKAAEALPQTASGVMVTRGGHILTHAQAVEDCRAIVVRGDDGEQREARVVLADRFNGLALVASADTHPGVPPRGPALAEGEAVTIRAYAAGASETPIAEAVEASVRSDPGLYRVDRRLVQLDQVVGASYLGAPVFDMGGRLAEIMVPGTETSEVAELRAAPGPVGFAIRREIAEPLLRLGGYAYDVDTTDRPPPPDAETRMRRATVAIECWREEEP